MEWLAFNTAPFEIRRLIGSLAPEGSKFCFAGAISLIPRRIGKSLTSQSSKVFILEGCEITDENYRAANEINSPVGLGDRETAYGERRDRNNH
jgi:hypothetical protein